MTGTLITALEWANVRLDHEWERLPRVSLCSASGDTLVSVTGHWNPSGRYGLRLGGQGVSVGGKPFEGLFAVLELSGQYNVELNLGKAILTITALGTDDFVVRLRSVQDGDFWREYLLPRVGKKGVSERLKPRQTPSPAVLAADKRRCGPHDRRGPMDGSGRMDCLIQ